MHKRLDGVSRYLDVRRGRETLGETAARSRGVERLDDLRFTP
ncbi:hypothetical protein Q5692_34940 [Microcoleus sp. C2C3]